MVRRNVLEREEGSYDVSDMPISLEFAANPSQRISAGHGILNR